MKKNNYIFIIVIFLIILIGDFTLIRNQKDISLNENRTLQKFEHLTVDTYLNGTYQSSLENALSDQFIGSDFVKSALNKTLNFVNYSKIPKFVCEKKYVNLDGTYNNYDCGDTLIVKYEELTSEVEANIKNRINVYNKLNDYIDTSYYFISTAAIYDFEKNDYNIDMLTFLKKNLDGNYNLSALEFKNYDEYLKYFYKTDHHWNHKGSYEGYKDIINMMKSGEQIMKPIEEVVFDDIIFYGSSARISQIFDYKENFKVYKFNFPDMEILNNRNSYEYGSEEDYFNGIYYTEKLVAHYGNYYGGDSGEVIFDTKNTEQENLLILGSSFTNAVNKLIASHYNKTYVIDLRHYEELADEVFNIKEYINENEIDKVLIIMDYGFLKDQSFNMDWGN